ncbi:MAG: neutral zinc metallopeptidase [Gammaproteobacteria bacterium]|nr:neutral zinc metallopeptidase [Gammaproteobacteria bacterium]
MRWRGRRQSSNVVDKRGSRMPRAARLGAGGGAIARLLPLVFRALGFKGTLIAIVLLVGYSYFSGDLQRFLGDGKMASSQPGSTKLPVKQSEAEKQLVEFVSTVLADTEDSWNELFRQAGKSYREPRLVLFREAVATACGTGSAQIGPFYCPADQKVYLDLSFFDELKRRHGAPGDFAQAYVIAHEVGHHVQTLAGITAKVHKAKKSLSQVEANRLSVKQELQADCYAGIWAHDARRSRQVLEAGDIEEGLAAASAIGDDRLQKQARGYVTPDSFTHGSSEQRVAWFKKGLSEGTLKACDTFAAAAL